MTGSFLFTGGPLPGLDVFGRTPEYLPHGGHQAGDRHLKTHKTRDNLHLTGEALKALSHRERPWRRFADADGRLISQNAVITREALAEWFTNDAEFVAHQEEVRRLEARRDIYGFDGPVVTPALRSATERVLRERMNQS